VEPGTTLFNLVSDIEIVKGFPKIHRAMVLEPTIQTHFKGLPLVAIEEKMKKGFPKIHRAMVLEPTIQTHFKGLPLVAIEEKMNGYNVRVVKIQDQVLALTRGGLVCPYTTEKTTQEIGLEFFRDHPDLVLCGEMVGPDNPYVPKDIYPEVESIAFYVFDIRESRRIFIRKWKASHSMYSISGKKVQVDPLHLKINMNCATVMVLRLYGTSGIIQLMPLPG
jgi:putative ATP-dependent DNA ligase